MGFKEAKRRVLEALAEGDFLNDVRDKIDEKNLLHTGEMTAEDVMEIVNMCNGTHHVEAPHHAAAGVSVHVLRRDGWYIKFYFIDEETHFLSVHG